MARFKIVFFGKQGCGKTQLSYQIALKDRYDENAPSTVGVEFSSRKIDDNNVLNLWDLTGNDFYKGLRQSYYKDAIVGLLCVDLTKKIDEEQITNEVQFFRGISPNTPIVLIGTKSDSPDANIEAFKKINSNNLFSNCIITSAKMKTGIDELYTEITNHCQGLNESLWNRSVQKLLVSLKELPLNKELLIKAELEKLSRVLLIQAGETSFNPQAKADAIENFTNNCTTILEGKHPNVLKAVISVAVAAVVTLVTALVGFSVGFFLGAWTGPGALVTGLIGAASVVVPSSVAVGAVAGGITACGLFRTSKEMHALNEFSVEVSSWNREIRL